MQALYLLLGDAAQQVSDLALFRVGFEHIFAQVIILVAHLVEIMGVVVLVIGAVKAFIDYFNRCANMRLHLAKSMALALEFKLGGEILRTAVAREWNEILLVGAIIALRCVLTFMIHWEINYIRHESDCEIAEADEGEGTKEEGARPESKSARARIKKTLAGK
ncbi:MAG: DUF1622 domain-containing protein [Clostridia bacterium]|nr:DUF1622 domain-containing protein [Clostridia bacterium]